LRHNKRGINTFKLPPERYINGKKPIVDADVGPLQILNKDQTTSERDETLNRVDAP
jgi:hypothetical protein